MEQSPSTQIEQLADLNPCIKFVIDNYDMLCCAHPGKVVMVMNRELFVGGPQAYVAKTFDSMVDAMMYTETLDMDHVPFALKECNGGDAAANLTFSIGCKGA